MHRDEFESLGLGETLALMREYQDMQRENNHAAGELAAMFHQTKFRQQPGNPANREHFVPFGRPDEFRAAQALESVRLAAAESRLSAIARAAKGVENGRGNL